MGFQKGFNRVQTLLFPVRVEVMIPEEHPDQWNKIEQQRIRINLFHLQL
jgi:hypothetical protein